MNKNPDSKTIIFVSSSLKRGGTQRVVSLITDEFISKGWNVHIVTLLKRNLVGTEYNLDSKITVHDLSKSSSLKNLFSWILGLRNILKEVCPNVIVSFVGRINMITMLAGIGLGIPILVSERNDPANDRRSNIEKKMCKHFYHRADAVVFQTEYQQNYYRKYCQHNSFVIGNPIAAPVYRGLHTNSDIIAVGKLEKQKNHPMLIDAFSRIASEFPEIKVHIYGEGSLRDELQTKINELGLKDRIILEGNTDKIFDVLHEYKYFVMCSDYEGLSNALLEAMISGMVCITTSWCGVDEIIRNSENGYLVPINDSVGLSEMLSSLLTIEEKKEKEITDSAVNTAIKYQAGNILSDWVGVINSLIE